jgi:hypothetical protein
VPHKPNAKRKLGLLNGKIKIPDDFLEEDDEISDIRAYLLLSRIARVVLQLCFT